MIADLVLFKANIRTFGPQKPVAEAVAIKGNKILKVGTEKEMEQLIGKNTKKISLEGKTVIPGLIDTHIHVADFGRCLLWLDLASVTSIKELQSLLKKNAKRTQSGRWIIGRGWNHNRFKEKRLLRKSDLDASAPDNPVVLYHEAAMICAVNSKAMEIAGVTEQTSAPEGGTIDKDVVTGEVVGVLRDSATNLIWQAVPEPTTEELLEATSVACKKIVEAGLTSVNWIVLSEKELPIIQQLHVKGELLARVNVIIPAMLLEKSTVLKSMSSLMLNFGGILITVDGYLDSKGAALFEPYSDDLGNSGTLLYSEESLTAFVSKVVEEGFQPVIQAMGDKAVDLALKSVEKTSHCSKVKHARFRLEQAALLNRQLVRRLKAQDIVVSIQPKVISTEFSVWSATKSLGVDRAKWLHPLKTLFAEGVKVTGGSDCPMEPLSPLLGVQEAVIRRVFPEQRLTIEEALIMYTYNAAYASGEEALKGTIEEGKLADFTILSEDPFEVKQNEIENLKVVMTIIDGKIVHC